jgi:broad specificity phosphatase PhoE
VLILVRHGRTAANASGLLLGRADPPLDEVGVAQSAGVAAELRDASRVVTSPLARTRATAEALGVPVSVDERWLELDYGEWDERPLRDVPPRDWATWMSDPTFAPPGGESLEELGRRVCAACDDLADEAAERDVVVVSHVSPIKAAVAWALDAGVAVTWHLYPAPASITRISTAGGRRVLQTYNQTAHLLGPSAA